MRKERDELSSVTVPAYCLDDFQDAEHREGTQAESSTVLNWVDGSGRPRWLETEGQKLEEEDIKICSLGRTGVCEGITRPRKEATNGIRGKIPEFKQGQEQCL